MALFALELAGPFLAERRRRRRGIAHHIAERYWLLVIITLGEVIIGTVAALNALVHGEAGWTVDAALLAVAGVGPTFGCWWSYFAIPWGEPLARHRERIFLFGYGHLLIFAPLAALGAGLHVAAYQLEGEAEIGVTAVVLSVVIPIAIFVAALYGLYSLLLREHDRFHIALIAGYRRDPGRHGAAGERRREHGGVPARRSRSRPRSPSSATRRSAPPHGRAPSSASERRARGSAAASRDPRRRARRGPAAAWRGSRRHGGRAALPLRVASTTLARPSVGCGRRWTRPSASRSATSAVAFGGSISSAAASSPIEHRPARDPAQRTDAAEAHPGRVGDLAPPLVVEHEVRHQQPGVAGASLIRPAPRG